MRQLLLLGAAGFSLILTQSGCPGGAELENPEAWPGRLGTGGTGTGGTGTGGMSPAAGTGSTPVLDFSTVDCGGLDPVAILKSDCSKTGCHKGTAAVPAVAMLDLVPNDGLAARVKDVPAQYLNIQCSGAGEPYMECVPTTCPTSNTTLLVDSKNVEESWMMKKIRNTTNACGDPMPATDGYVTGNPNEACVENIIRAIAALP